MVVVWKDGGPVIKEYRINVRNGVIKTLKRVLMLEEKKLREDKGKDVAFGFTILSVLDSNVGSVFRKGKNKEGRLFHGLELREEELRFVDAQYDGESIWIERPVFQVDYKRDVSL